MTAIDIENELIAFKKHLDINERTIFSAKFGDGKTFFLDKFKTKFKDNYEFITIYPVNYQISDNKEVFEYIKRDILIQMVSKKMIKPSYEIPDSLIFQFFIMQNFDSFLGNLLKILPSLGIPEQTVSLFLSEYKSLNWPKKISEKYKEYKNAIQNLDEDHIIEEFIKSFSKKAGGPYEIDLITQIIIDNIQWFSNTKSKKVILIIEDLDRMDPAHLFRILNIFSAHIDRVYQYKDENTSYPELLPNKFGFDNIITVFDYDKTKNIFHHFYGQQANYEGYINKFTSHQPFFYSIDEIAREYLYKVISEKCCITKESIRQISQLINNKIDLLSVRDVCNILSGIDLYIQEDTYNSNYNFNTKSPLTYMISILKLLGISQKDEIKHYILQLPILDLLNCINVFLYIYVVDNFIFKGMMLSIIKSNPSGNMIENKIQIIESKNIYSYAKLSDDQVESCIDKAFRYIIK
ncbi:hypothetical protein [Prevotella sp.]|uniref:hypothetical protein n=1 Tax=Prevotella sp. TaxID=59823 RepID=UPI003AB7ACE0